MISRLAEGDHEAFRILVERFRRKVISTSMGFIHSEADAEDIAQDVFLEVFSSIKKFRSGSSLSTWIYRITVNKSLNHIRSSKRHKLISLFESFAGDEDKPSAEPASGSEYCPDDGLKKSDQAKALEQAMNRLAPNQKTAFVLSRYDDLSYEEIADVMKTSVPAVESLIFRAKQNLQKSLLAYYSNNFK